jgi:hypothetical protein
MSVTTATLELQFFFSYLKHVEHNLLVDLEQYHFDESHHQQLDGADLAKDGTERYKDCSGSELGTDQTENQRKRKSLGLIFSK